MSEIVKALKKQTEMGKSKQKYLNIRDMVRV